jgi:hypothetical protein
MFMLIFLYFQTWSFLRRWKWSCMLIGRLACARATSRAELSSNVWLAVNEQRATWASSLVEYQQGSCTCVILYLYIIRWFVFVSVVSMFWSGRVQPGRYHRMLSFERALIGSCLGNFLWALPDSEYRCVQFGLDWNAHRSMLYVWGIFPVVLATDHVHSE